MYCMFDIASCFECTLMVVVLGVYLAHKFDPWIHPYTAKLIHKSLIQNSAISCTQLAAAQLLCHIFLLSCLYLPLAALHPNSFLL